MIGRERGPESGRAFTVSDGERSRFFARVKRIDGQCWQWRGAVNQKTGYATMSVGYRKGPTAAHRVSWAIHHGVLPAGACVCHRCDTPTCTNPDHLFLGTHAENMRDMYAKGRGHIPVLQPLAPCGHYFTPNSTIHGTQGRSCGICFLLAEQDRVTATYRDAKERLRAAVAASLVPYLPSEPDMRRMLDPRWFDILAHSFGLFGREPVTATVLGYSYGVSRQRIDQIRQRALRKLGLPETTVSLDAIREFGFAAGAVNMIPGRQIRRVHSLNVRADVA